MSLRFIRTIPALLATMAALTSAAHAQLQVTYGSKGVQTLSYNGVTLENVAAFSGDQFHIWHMKATDLNGNVMQGGQYGWGEVNNGTTWNAQTLTETYNFTWGSISTQFVQSGNNLNLIVTETNYAGSGILFDGAEIYPLALHFPQEPAGFYGYTQYAITTTDPGISVADYGSGIVTAVLPDESKAVYTGWKNAGTATYSPLMTTTYPDGIATFLPHNDLPLAPGNTLTYTLSLRFTPEGTAANIADATASFAQTFPSQMTWSDKRIIGTAYLASSPAGGGDITQPGGFPTNPRRYFNDSTIDITSAAGLQSFQKRMLAQAANQVVNAKNMNAQGVITWDIEGEQYPQDTSYVCSPDQIAAVSPEMESTISDSTSPFFGQKLDDAYFKTMTNAGLRVGVCLRPQAFTLGANGTASQQFLSTNAAIIANLENKARVAYSRWGATLFYVDSVVDANGGTLDPAIFQQLSSDLPNVLFIPEEFTTRYYAYTAPFYSFIFHTTTGTAASVYHVYPHAFGANLVNDANPSTLAQDTPQLTAAVEHGDILMGHADYWQANDPTLEGIYNAAGVTGPPAATLTTPTIVWSTPNSITYGTALSAAQLNATASVPGTFTYTPALGTVLPAGTQTLNVSFTPANTSAYKSTSATIQLTVGQAKPAITWATPASITSGTALSAAQLEATASVPGTFTYTPAAGVVPAAGTLLLTASFTPADKTDFQSTSATVLLTVIAVPVAPLAPSPAPKPTPTPAPTSSPITAPNPTPVPSTTNLVKDPGFELQTGSALSGPWSAIGSSHLGVDRNLGNAHSGLNNAYIWDNSGSWNALQQTVAVQPHTEYVFSAWVRSSLAAPVGTLSVLGNAGLVSQVSFGDLRAYTLEVVRFNSGANTSVTLQAGLTGQNTVQWVQIDDVALRTNLLSDPGFELQKGRSLTNPWTQLGSGLMGVDNNLGNANTGANNGWIWNNNGGFNAIAQTVAVQPNTNYAFTGWIRSSLISQLGYFSVDGANGILKETSFAGLPGYTQLTVTFNSGNNTSVRVRAGFWGAGTVQWIQTDDFALQQTQ